MVANVIIVSVVIALFALCIRSIARAKGGDCSSCGSSGSCSAHKTGQGSCSVAQKMVEHADAALQNR